MDTRHESHLICVENVSGKGEEADEDTEQVERSIREDEEESSNEDERDKAVPQSEPNAADTRII